MATPRLRLGQLLVDAKLISAQALDEVLHDQRSDGRRLGTLLVERGLINETQLTQILSHQLSVPWVSLLHIEFSRQLLNLVPYDVADRYCLLPIYVRHVRGQGDTLYVAMDDPSNEEGLGACREHSGLPVRAMIAPPQDIRNAIRVYYGVVRPASVVEPPPAAVVEAPAAETARAPSVVVEEVPASEAHAALAEAEAAEVEAEVPVAQATIVEAAAPVEEIAPAPRSARRPAHEVEAAFAAVSAAAEEPVPLVTRSVRPAGLASAGLPSNGGEPGPELDSAERAPRSSRPVPSSSPPPSGRSPAERLRALLAATPPAPPAVDEQVENIPRPRGRSPRMVALTLLDGTTITLPAKRRGRPAEPPADAPAPPPEERAQRSEPPGPDELHGLTARDLVTALRAVSHGADASEVLGTNVSWEAMFAALLSLMLKKHLIADWEFVEELKKF